MVVPSPPTPSPVIKVSSFGLPPSPPKVMKSLKYSPYPMWVVFQDSSQPSLAGAGAEIGNVKVRGASWFELPR